MKPTQTYKGHITYKLVIALKPVFININAKFKNCKIANIFTFFTGKCESELLEKKTPI